MWLVACVSCPYSHVYSLWKYVDPCVIGVVRVFLSSHTGIHMFVRYVDVGKFTLSVFTLVFVYDLHVCLCMFRFYVYLKLRYV